MTDKRTKVILRGKGTGFNIIRDSLQKMDQSEIKVTILEKKARSKE